MTIDEAIRHCEEVAERYETRAKIIDRRKLGFALENPTVCHECAADHRQLAEWLQDLKTASFLLGEAINEMYKGTSCNPTAWLNKYGETARELIRRVDYDT